MNKTNISIIILSVIAGAYAITQLHGNTGYNHILEETLLPLLLSIPILLSVIYLTTKYEITKFNKYLYLTIITSFTHSTVALILIITHKYQIMRTATLTPDSQAINLVRIESFTVENKSHFFGDINPTQRIHVEASDIHSPIRFIQVKLNNNTQYHCVTSSETPTVKNCHTYKINGLNMYCDDKTGELVCSTSNPNNYTPKRMFHH